MIRLIACILGCILLLSGCEQEVVHTVSGNTVKIGIVGPFSGADQEWGENGILGVKTALAMRPYLSNGDKPELIIKDDKNDPSLTAEVLNQLVREEVSAILIFSDSGAVLPVIKTIDQLQVPVLALIATHPEVTSSEWVSQFAFDDILQGTIAALFVIDELLIEHVGVVVDEEDPHSVFLGEEFSRRFKEAGGIVDQVRITNKTDDFSKIVGGFRGRGIDFLYLPLTADQVIKIEQAVTKMGWNPQIMVSDGLLSQIHLQHRDDLDIVDGMLAIDVYSTGLPRTNYGRRASALFNKKFDEVGTTFTGLGCEGMSVLMAAIDQCEDPTDRACINRMLRSTNGFSGLFGKIFIGSSGKTERPVFVNSINNGKLEFVVKIY